MGSGSLFISQQPANSAVDPYEVQMGCTPPLTWSYATIVLDPEVLTFVLLIGLGFSGITPHTPPGLLHRQKHMNSFLLEMGINIKSMFFSALFALYYC